MLLFGGPIRDLDLQNLLAGNPLRANRCSPLQEFDDSEWDHNQKDRLPALLVLLGERGTLDAKAALTDRY